VELLQPCKEVSKVDEVFRARAALQAENLVLRHQLNVLRRKSPKRLAFGCRLVFTALYHVAH